MQVAAPARHWACYQVIRKEITTLQSGYLRQSGRQTDRQTDEQTDGRTDGQTNEQTNHTVSPANCCNKICIITRN